MEYKRYMCTSSVRWGVSSDKRAWRCVVAVHFLTIRWFQILHSWTLIWCSDWVPSFSVNFPEMRKVHPWHVRICITKAAQPCRYLNNCFFSLFVVLQPILDFSDTYVSIFDCFSPFFDQNILLHLNHMSNFVWSQVELKTSFYKTPLAESSKGAVSWEHTRSDPQHYVWEM